MTEQAQGHDHADHHRHAHHGDHAPPATAPASSWICPMHPEIVRDGPAACPICGMALEPSRPTAHSEADNPELADMRRRFWIALAFTLPVFVLEMGSHVFGALLPGRTSALIGLALSTPVVWWAGLPFFRRGLASLRSGHLNMFTLIAFGVFVAWSYSLVALLVPGLFPQAMAGMPDGPPVYFEAAAVIVTLALLGQVLELKARAATGQSLKALMALEPRTAIRLSSCGHEREIAIAEIAVGDSLRVRAGAAVPVDGVLTEGRASIDEAMVTGESLPVEKGEGDAVTGGTVNGSTAFLMRAEHVGRDTVLARIVALVAEAQRSRAPVQRLADRVAAWFVPIVIGVALAAFAGWMVFGPNPRLPHALIAAVSVLIIACPCALGLATPMAVMAGIGRGARAGILIRDAASLERFARADTLILDKTGTLTKGRPSLMDFDGDDETLRLAASIEAHATHPLADAIVAGAKTRNLALTETHDVDAPPGKGASGTVEGKTIRVGAKAFLAEAGIDTQALDAKAEAFREKGATAVYIAIENRAAGLAAIADPLKDGAADAIKALKAEGLTLVMASGDHEATARAIASQTGLDDVRAGITPEGKADLVRQLHSQGHIVAMAGDGVNDAPALAAADAGIAMGGGAAAALKSAGLTLAGGDLATLLRARRLAAATLATIRQNLAFAFVYNLAGVPLAAGLLYPFTGLMLSPEVAALAMALSSVSVIANALRLSRTPL